MPQGQGGVWEVRGRTVLHRSRGTPAPSPSKGWTGPGPCLPHTDQRDAEAGRDLGLGGDPGVASGHRARGGLLRARDPWAKGCEFKHVMGQEPPKQYKP